MDISSTTLPFRSPGGFGNQISSQAIRFSPIPSSSFGIHHAGFGHYNAFIIFAYVVASSFTFGYVHWKSGSITAAVAAGIIYGTGSFMVAHLGHASIIHAGAWVPLIVWSIDALADRRTAGRFVTGAVAIAMCLLGGHPQIFVYAMLLAGGLALRKLWVTYAGDSAAAIRLAAAYATMVALGVSTCAVALLPFLEFSKLSARTDVWNYDEFVSYSLPLRQIAMLFFPYIYGGGINGAINYFGAWNQTELATYAGAGALFLAACGILAGKRDDDALFWLAAGVASILLATVGENHLGYLFYHIPVVNGFRAAARSAMVFTFAISVLAGAGIAASAAWRSQNSTHRLGWRIHSWFCNWRRAIDPIIGAVAASASGRRCGALDNDGGDHPPPNCQSGRANLPSFVLEKARRQLLPVGPDDCSCGHRYRSLRLVLRMAALPSSKAHIGRFGCFARGIIEFEGPRLGDARWSSAMRFNRI